MNTSLISPSDFTGCIYTGFIPIKITSSAMGLKFFARTAEIKKYKSINKKKEENHDKIALLAKPKVNSTEVLIYQALIVSNICILIKIVIVLFEV